MRLFLYLRHFPPYGDKLNNGLSKAIHGLAAGLVTQGATVTILSEGSSSEDSSFLTAAGYTVECFANPVQSRPSFKLSPSLQTYIRDCLKSTDLVVLNGILHPTIYSVSRALKRLKIPYIVAPHDVYHRVMFRKNAHLKFPYWYLLEKRVLNQARSIQVLDGSQAKWLKCRGIKTQIFVTPNGFSPADLCSESDLGWSDGSAPKLFYFGRLDAYHKGLDLLLAAFADIAQPLNAHLTLQGPNGGDRDQLKQQARSLLASNQATFLEPEYNKSASLVIANYDIFCLPSRFEGFGLSALEAMLAGRVLLVSEECGIATHVRASGCGVVVKPEISAIQSGLIDLCQLRGDWRTMGLSGRQYVLEHLRWEQIASNTLDHYQHLVV